MTYWYLTNGIMPFYVSMWSLTGTQNYRFYGVVFGIVGGIHELQILRILEMSIRSRRLTLRSDTNVVRVLASKAIMSSRQDKSAEDVAKKSSSGRSCMRLAAPFAVIWKKVFSRQGLFGVESEHFSTVFAFREVLEASSQTYQAYRASNLLPHPGLNSIIVGLLITNCWTTAAIEFFLRKSPALERVVTLTYDASISFGMMIAVPLSIFLPYVAAFNFEYSSFKNPDILYAPVTISAMVLENRLIFASSLFDFGTKLIPQLSIILSLVTVSELLGRGDAKVVAGVVQTVVVRPKDGNAAEVKTLSGDQKSPAESALQKWKHVIVVVLFVLWGSIIILFHGLAAQRAANYEIVGCRSVTRPWFSNGKEPCASLVYDCHALNTTTPDQTSFDKLDHDALATLAIVHCPELAIPPDFQRLESLEV